MRDTTLVWFGKCCAMTTDFFTHFSPHTETYSYYHFSDLCNFFKTDVTCNNFFKFLVNIQIRNFQKIIMMHWIFQEMYKCHEKIPFGHFRLCEMWFSACFIEIYDGQVYLTPDSWKLPQTSRVLLLVVSLSPRSHWSKHFHFLPPFPRNGVVAIARGPKQNRGL